MRFGCRALRSRVECLGLRFWGMGEWGGGFRVCGLNAGLDLEIAGCYLRVLGWELKESGLDNASEDYVGEFSTLVWGC